MVKLLLWVGRSAGAVGVLLCVVAAFVRMRGVYALAGFQVGTVLLAGIAAMLVGCLGYIAAVAERQRE